MTETKLLLTEVEISEVTGYRRRSLQARWCVENGIEYRRRRDGSLVIAREHFLRVLGVARKDSKAKQFEPDFSALQ